MALGFMAYFVKKLDPVTGIVRDGLGRQLSEPPLIATIVLETDGKSWAGFGWYCLDLIVAIAVGGLIHFIYELGEENEK